MLYDACKRNFAQSAIKRPWEKCQLMRTAIRCTDINLE